MAEESDAVDLFADVRENHRHWSCVVDRNDYRHDIVADLDRVARLAWAGAWEDLFPLLERPTPPHGPELINTPRVGTSSGYATLHHAAWHGADRNIVQRLLDLRAWRTLRTTGGQTPADIAAERGHTHLDDLLAVQRELPCLVRSRVATERLLHALIESRLGRYDLDGPLRLPQLGPLREIEPQQSMWCQIPGMYGGFTLRWDGEAVITTSMSRMAEGAEEQHRITDNEIRLVPHEQ